MDRRGFKAGDHSLTFDEFHVIGWLPPGNAGLDFSYLARPPSSTKIPRLDFLMALKSIDYVCMPYCSDLYKYSASGTLMDAVASAKPVLALRSPVLEDLQNRYGHIGEFADDITQLEFIIADLLIKKDTKRYSMQAATMQKIRIDRMPRNLCSHWRKIASFEAARPPDLSRNGYT